MRKLIRSFGYAFSGLYSALKTERNLRIHLLLATAAVMISVYLNISKEEWLWIGAAVFSVFSAELFNTAIERLCDKITKEKNEDIKYIKDISAAAVVCAALFALLAGGLIWLPYLINT